MIVVNASRARRLISLLESCASPPGLTETCSSAAALKTLDRFRAAINRPRGQGKRRRRRRNPPPPKAKHRRVSVLVATDVAVRGIGVSDLVVHYQVR